MPFLALRPFQARAITILTGVIDSGSPSDCLYDHVYPFVGHEGNFGAVKGLVDFLSKHKTFSRHLVPHLRPPYYFAHGDLCAANIMIGQDSTGNLCITGIVDWDMGGEERRCLYITLKGALS